jgi:trimethylamine--corrinoid protein Co-methyltransferase
MAKQRDGVLVDPEDRLSAAQVDLVDGVSRELLEDPGLLCFNPDAAELYGEAGAGIEPVEEGCVRVRLTPDMVDEALSIAPSKIVLGARNPDNRLILDAAEPRVRFVSGSETNIWLELGFEDGQPTFSRRKGSIGRLCRAAHLAENLEHLDSFIRCVNIQDEEVTRTNKDVNKLLASLNNISKHVQAGLTSLGSLDDVMEMARIVAGGESALRENPVISFITCVVKSPLQMVEDTTDKLIEICRRRVPVVISSSPMGGTTAPFDEFGMVAQINAEILSGVVLTQLVAPGTPVLYGSVPVRSRLDTLEDMYGAPEFNHYNVDCAQMARHYGLPCYSTANVGDAAEPGIQATAEKMLTLTGVPRSGAQYVHYAFGLLDRTSVFCPEQAVLDDAHIGLMKYNMQRPNLDKTRRDEVLSMVREVMETDHKTYMYHLPMPTREEVYVNYPLEDEEGGALMAAHKRYHEILEAERDHLPSDIQDDIRRHVPGVLEKSLEL